MSNIHIKPCFEADFDFSIHFSSKYIPRDPQKNDILTNSDKNAFSKHLQIFHPDHIRELKAFKLKVESTNSKCLESQVKEGVFINNNNSEADHMLNSKAEYHQPALRHVTTTRENRHSS